MSLRKSMASEQDLDDGKDDDDEPVLSKIDLDKGFVFKSPHRNKLFPFLHGDGKLSKSKPPAISILNSNTPPQELQVSWGMISESSGIDLKPFADKVMERPQNIQQEKAPDDLMAEGQRIAKDQHHVYSFSETTCFSELGK
ncbi:hypothetical protein RHGRI_035971 [Rhododendron griersonianum]|uniref:Uncharacterized protein n=1 Tax=Rhododendron griersonianum TaxID=479676 RepID=A0AAV6HQA1_9ERIC|nr:hypothetical protein RHGRI_035971 [Rhododendron griersonianum]